MKHLRITRDTLLFTLGALGFLHELFYGGAVERPFILTVCAALMGLPLVLRAEEKARRNGRDDK